MRQAYIKTFGCQMNEHDSQKMEASLRREGYTRAGSPEEADLIVVNTCSIREKAYQKAVSEIGRMRNLKSVVAVTGCVASQEGASLRKRFPFVDIVLGPDHESSLPRLVKEIAEKKGRVATDFKDLSDYEFPAEILEDTEPRAKAMVTIMKGCDNACSFCIVPFVRGPEVSRSSEEILDEIRRLEGQGVREVLLLGQTVNSYGKGLVPRISFAGLLRRIDEETRVSRLRFTSPHPKDLSSELIQEYRRNEKLCPQIHLPVQAGSDRVLKRMRRSYTRKVYLRKVGWIREAVPEIAVSTDIIVGFPGETERDFKETLSLMNEVRYDMSYSFSYSPRPNTEAHGFPDDVSPEVKKERLARVQELQARLSLAVYSSRVGRVEKVLAEGVSREGSGQLTGRTPHGRIVNFDGDASLAGAILDVKITGASSYSLKGVLKTPCSSK